MVSKNRSAVMVLPKWNSIGVLNVDAKIANEEAHEVI